MVTVKSVKGLLLLQGQCASLNAAILSTLHQASLQQVKQWPCRQISFCHLIWLIFISFASLRSLPFVKSFSAAEFLPHHSAISILASYTSALLSPTSPVHAWHRNQALMGLSHVHTLLTTPLAALLILSFFRLTPFPLSPPRPRATCTSVKC